MKQVVPLKSSLKKMNPFANEFCMPTLMASLKKYTIFSMLFSSGLVLNSQQVIDLYSNGIPNSIQGPNEEFSDTTADGILIVHNTSHPTLTIFLPSASSATGAAVIICPGGGYGILAAAHEGYDVAKRFNEMGIAAFVLKYRMPNRRTMTNPEIGPLQDAQRAIQLVRSKSKEWGISKNKIGIMGFSAGGHLAASAGTHFNKSYIDNRYKISLRPNFMILVYPVISFQDSIGHMGSRENLLGKNAATEKIAFYSNELQVTAKTPPAFLVHAKDDPIKVENSLVFAEALKKNAVSHEIYLYEKGGHGYGMINPSSEVKWMDLVYKWMQKMKIIK
ncbi:MAG: alpha/beta hydrolase [Chitinophagaceae bacterium]